MVDNKCVKCEKEFKSESYHYFCKVCNPVPSSKNLDDVVNTGCRFDDDVVI